MVDLAGVLLLVELCLHAQRVVRVGACKLAHGPVERRREEHRLPVSRHMPENLVDLRLESHVEHPVGLVEDQNRDRVE